MIPVTDGCARAAAVMAKVMVVVIVNFYDGCVHGDDDGYGHSDDGDGGEGSY